MNNDTCCNENVTNTQVCSRRPSGLIIAVVLYILLAIILSSFRAC